MTLAAGHPLYLGIVWALWLARLFALPLLAPRAARWPRLHALARAYRIAFGWIEIFLHELSHAVVALLTGYRVTRFIVHWDWGYVGTFGNTRTHWVWLMAPLLWWWLAMQGMYLLATRELPWWQGIGIALALPLLFAAGKPSGGDVRNAQGTGLLIVGVLDLLLILAVPVPLLLLALGYAHI